MNKRFTEELIVLILKEAGDDRIARDVCRIHNISQQTFETAIIERYRRRETSVEEAMVEMYLAGVSVHRVEDVTEALWGTRVSSSTVSKLNQKIYKHIERWRNQPIEEVFPYVYLDGVVLKRNWAGECATSRSWWPLASQRTAIVVC